MRTEVRPAGDPEAAFEAAETLEDGRLVALPTETVYGLAADALDPAAVARVFEVKERPSFDPLICHLPDPSWLDMMTRIPDASRPLIGALTARFWPGPLTLVLPKSHLVPDIVTSGLPKVAVRLSAHPVLQRVMSFVKRPLAAPSANRFGRISPTTAAHVLAELDGRIPLILDAGPTQHGIESTIIAIENETVRILRSGPVTRDELLQFAPTVEAPAPASPEAPGQLASHYAPRTPMRLIGNEGAFPTKRTGLLAWREIPEGDFAAIEVLSPRGDLREAAATLFAKMRRLDDAGLDEIVAQPVPEHGLGVAIMDRLRKASAPSLRSTAP
jgi:L-threonylcarbamoyladenylate synthase